MFSHKIDKSQGIIFTRATGTPTTVTMIDHIQRVLNDPDFDPNYNSIIILEEHTHIAGVPTEKIEIIRRVLDGYAQQRKGRHWAVIASNERQQAFLRLNLELIGPLKFNIRIFRSEEDALNWIKRRQPPLC
jgi:hypothetical protein